MNENIYIKNGYTGRGDYLRSLSGEYGLSLKQMEEIAALLGPTEDFDGLAAELRDHFRPGKGW